MTTANLPSSQLSEAAKPQVKGASIERSQRIWGWIFLSPWIIGFLAFILIPMVVSLIFSFTSFKLNQPDQVQYIGTRNYEQLFKDPLVGISLAVTLRFAIFAIPVSIVIPIALAALLNSESLRAKRIFRTLFYMPYIVPIVSAVYIWKGILNLETGWINRFLNLLGISGPDWLNSITWVYPALVLIGIWGLGNAFLLTLAGMQTVPTELYEAARVDGANAWKRFRNITLPIISPVIFYNLVLAVIGMFRYFEIPFILTEGTGNPGNATMFFNIHFYKTAFVFLDMGYGSALAWLLFAITMVVTLVLFLIARYWVYYASGDET